MKWFAVCLLLLVASSHEKHFPENPRAIVRYGCVVQARQNDPYWRVYVWAQMTPDVNCSDELVHHQNTGKAIDQSCFVYQLAMTPSRKRGLSYCNDWMSNLHDEILKPRK